MDIVSRFVAWLGQLWGKFLAKKRDEEIDAKLIEWEMLKADEDIAKHKEEKRLNKEFKKLKKKEDEKRRKREKERKIDLEHFRLMYPHLSEEELQEKISEMSRRKFFVNSMRGTYVSTSITKFHIDIYG